MATTDTNMLASDWLPNIFSDPTLRRGLETFDQLVGRVGIHEHSIATLAEQVSGLLAHVTPVVVPPVVVPPVVPPAPAATGTIVPLYTRPEHPSWSAIIAAKKAHPRVPVVAIINPANGPGTAAPGPYTAGVARLTAVGIVVIGYVSTSYGVRPEADVVADIDRWRNFYPGVSGIFFDEQNNKAGGESYYRRLSTYAKAHGLPLTVGNPGTDTSESYIGVLDTMLIYESKGVPTAARLGGWHSKYPRSNFGIIPYGVTLDAAYVKAARSLVGYIYLQNDDLPNPWDTLPPYFDGLLAALE